MPAVTSAAQSASNGYQINEVFFGSGGELQACSSGPTGYCAKQSAGETAVGETCSNGATGYCAQTGFNTDRLPYLEFIVGATNINLGELNSSITATATATFSVKTYLASGYAVTNASNPPSNGTYTMNALATPTASSNSLEQFGINVVSNTTACGAPINFGANPVQVPNSTTSFGVAANDYNTCGLFKYVKGDAIASADKSSGETDFTVSYIFNVSRVTPGGIYTLNHVIVATSTF